ncbi:MAG TPA: alpha-galactosidase [bacterium]|nr:alpha-galactosidase [bacterium]
MKKAVASGSYEVNGKRLERFSRRESGRAILFRTVQPEGIEITVTVRRRRGRSGGLEISHRIANRSKRELVLGACQPFSIEFSSSDPAEVRLFLNSGNPDNTCVARAGARPPFPKNSIRWLPADAERLVHTGMDFMLAFDPESRQALICHALTFQSDSPFFTCPAPRPGETGLRLELRGDYRGFRLKPGERLEGDRYRVRRGRDPFRLLEKMADDLARANRTTRLPRETAWGWCSWYSRAQGIDRRYIIDSVRLLQKRLDGRGRPLVLVDHGWQAAGGTLGRHEGSDRRFPGGMKRLAGEIRALGGRPAIWFSPVRYNGASPFLKAHPEAALREARSDEALKYRERPDENGRCSYFLDPTHPQTRREVVRCLERFAGWGYDYLKADFVEIPDWFAYRHHDRRTAANGPVNRALFETIYPAARRLGMRVLACITFIDRLDGLKDDQRVAHDTNPAAGPDHLAAMATTVFSRYFYHRRLQHNDPDCLCLTGRPPKKPELSEGEARLRTLVVFLSGGTILLGDDPALVPEERFDLFRRCLPVFGRTGRPLDLFEAGGAPAVHRLEVPDYGDGRVLTAFTNFTGRPRSFRLEAAENGKPAAGLELFSGREFRLEAGESSVTVPPLDAALYLLVPELEHPWLTGTDRHWTGGFKGVVDRLAWDPARRTLRFRFRNLFNHPAARFWIQWPAGYRPAGLKTSGAAAAWEAGGVLRLARPSISENIQISFKTGEVQKDV